ncbi:MAG: transglutaminaseTgpA domain-containing protein [Planctomycetota bacterium]
MNQALQLGLVLLVALNLAFVHLTGAVAPRWLAVLFVFTLTAPLTARWRDSRLWCSAWNLGVIGTFVSLVHDATTVGARNLLEDGMTLAAFCQVHLLNVLRDERRADLLFFNSFLIAVVTSFFAQDLAFSLVFALWALAFVTTLIVSQERALQLSPRDIRDGLVKALQVLLGTGIVFAFWPRDFRRPGLVDDTLLLAGIDQESQVGFADRIDLRRSSHVTISHRVALTAKLEDGTHESVPEYWRGKTLDAWDGRRWMQLPNHGRTIRVEPTWRSEGRQTWARENALVGSERARLVVTAESDNLRNLFVPLEATRVRSLAANDREHAVPIPDGNFARLPTRGRPPKWEVTIGATAPMEGDIPARSLARWTQLSDDPAVVPPIARALAGEAVRSLSEAADRGTVARACRDLLADRFAYLAPGEQGAADGLEQFLAGDAPAHCEYFATALALLLRCHAIPCRVVTGYLAHEWSDDGKTLLIRDSDAHAWVEVFDEQSGWYALDATPALAENTAANDSFFATLGAWLRESWNEVTTFDAARREALVRRLIELPRNVVDHAVESPLVTSSSVGLLAWLVVRLRARRGRNPGVLDYERALRRWRLVRAANETPRELLDRVRREGSLQPERLAELERATANHERQRFAAVP